MKWVLSDHGTFSSYRAPMGVLPTLCHFSSQHSTPFFGPCSSIHAHGARPRKLQNIFIHKKISKKFQKVMFLSYKVDLIIEIYKYRQYKKSIKNRFFYYFKTMMLFLLFA